MLVHGNNIAQKIRDQRKYNDKLANRYLKEINKRYGQWRTDNLTIKGPYSTPNECDSAIIEQRVNLLNDYKDFIEQQQYAEKFDSRSNLQSSVLEEFLYYLFKDLAESYSSEALIGKSHAFKDIFFMPKNYREMVSNPCVRIEKKDHDFVIGVNIQAKMNCTGSEQIEDVLIQVPAIAIECKTYVDKTMLEGASTAGAQLKMRNPNSLYFVVAEWLKLTENVNLKKYQIDQVYVLRKQKNTDREFRFLPSYVKNPIYLDVVEHLFLTVRNHLSTDWEGGVSYGLGRGFLI
jgi:hypothetical protein